MIAKRLSIVIEEAELDLIDRAAAALHINRSAFMRQSALMRAERIAQDAKVDRL